MAISRCGGSDRRRLTLRCMGTAVPRLKLERYCQHQEGSPAHHQRPLRSGSSPHIHWASARTCRFRDGDRGMASSPRLRACVAGLCGANFGWRNTCCTSSSERRTKHTAGVFRRLFLSFCEPIWNLTLSLPKLCFAAHSRAGRVIEFFSGMISRAAIV